MSSLSQNRVFYDNRCIGRVVDRDEFIARAKADPGRIYDNLLYCGAPAVIFEHDETEEIAIDDANSVWVQHNDGGAA